MAVNEQTYRLSLETSKAVFRVANFPFVVAGTSKVSKPMERVYEFEANCVTSDGILKCGGQGFKIIVCWSLDRSGEIMPHSMLGVAIKDARREKQKLAAVLKLRVVNTDRAKSIQMKAGSADVDKMWGWYPRVHATLRESSDGFILLQDVLDPGKGWLTEGDVLTVECEMEMAESKVQNVNSSFLSSGQSASQHLGTQFGALLDTGRHSDVTIVAESQRLHAHSLVLMAWSPVFDAMWTHSMKENDEKVVTIIDVDPAAISHMLNFMYKGELNASPIKDDEILSLLQVAHKYQILVLVDLCVSTLASRLTESNAIRFLELADLVGLESMKRECLDFITATTDTIAGIQATDEFKDLSKKRPHLLADILSNAFPPAKAPRKR